RNVAQQGCGPYTDLTNVGFGNDEYDTRLTHDLGGTAAYTVNVDQDTWIRDDLPTNNYAADTRMHIRSQGGVTERPLLRYDLSKIPAKAAILSATAWFYVNKEHSEGPVDIHLITTDWIDTDATWDSMNANLGSAVVASIPTEPGTGVWVSANLAAQVQAWINGEANYGITINTDSDGVHSEYLSRESAFPPYLEVIVGSPPTSPAKLMSTSKIDGGGAATVKRDDVGLDQNPASFTQLR
ncbi:MAG: DNRLRE domain-containing protein, partial [bacterium]|nr:DNRLRE domain-containing protein [bacterium]